jgi:AcrR family transcriptional regulator
MFCFVLVGRVPFSRYSVSVLSQVRAEATRRRIIAAAVELFDEDGYSATSLGKIIRRANVTSGAFYYHFASKEEVAIAIIDQVTQQTSDLRQEFVGTPESGLKNVIEMAFKLSLLLNRDPSFRVAGYLDHTTTRYTDQGLVDVAERVAVFVVDIAQAIKPSELREGVTPEAVARTIVTLVYGILAMTDLLEGDITTRLVEFFRILLPGIAPPESLPHLEAFVSSKLRRG